MGKQLITNHASQVAYNSNDKGSGLKLWGSRGLGWNFIQELITFNNKHIIHISGMLNICPTKTST